MRRTFALLLITLLTSPALTQAKQTTRNAPLALTHVNIIGMAGAKPKSDMTVIIVGNRIAAVGKTRELRLPKDAQVINAAGKYLIPGLWDMHVHLGVEEFDRDSNLRLFIANGITGIRIMAGEPVYHLWRKEADGGALLAPKMFIASQVIGFGGLSNISRAQSREEVRKARRAGADFIKVHDNLSRESYYALVDEAKRLGLSVEGHIPASIRAGEASRAGQKSFEHLTGLSPAEPDRATAERWFAVFRKNQTWQCPTLIMRHNYAFLNDNSLASDPRLKYVKPSWKTRWLRMTDEARMWPEAEAAKRREIIRKEALLVGKMQKAGVGILAGTDDANPYVFPGFSLHDELALLVRAGLSPLEALQTATYNPARFFGMLSTLGTVERGKFADLVLLDANPLENISNTKKIAAVITNGRYLQRESLDKILAEIAAAANGR
jgi:imidazolonepropionase-like amidohydrolase